jgi:hypothetical protein
MWTVVPAIYKVLTVPYIQASIFNLTDLCCHRRCLDNSTRVILKTWCQIQPTSPGLRYVKCGPGHTQCNYSYVYSGFKFQVDHIRCYWRYPDISMCVILPIWCQIQRTSSSLRYLNCGPRYIECSYSSAYSGFNIQLTIPALELEICRHLGARYTAILVPNTAHVLHFKLSELWARTYTL